ncbi:MAG: hypothetical protein JWR00_1544 [Rubritepida sp.]|nr:hypothetical protein [Rubritepida sp.]
MHYRDLADWSAEREGGDAGPHFHRFAERNAVVFHFLLPCLPWKEL